MLKKWLLICFLLLQLMPVCFANKPDSVYLVSYTTGKNNNTNGLHFARSHDLTRWESIGNEFTFLWSDYGRWGTQKKMISPYVILGKNGEWQCVWQLNEQDRAFAHASSNDLVYWGRQSYPVLNKGVNCLQPIIWYNASADNYTVVYKSNDGKYYAVSTTDFKSYTPAAEVAPAAYNDESITAIIDGVTVKGQMHKVAWAVVQKLNQTFEASSFKRTENSETTVQDAQRFAGLKPVDVKMSLLPSKTKAISDMLLGIFFEDINYAADGGLYAELIQNRDFEYSLADKEGNDTAWNSTNSWSVKGTGTAFTIDSVSPVHKNNLHYAVLKTVTTGAALTNTGFDGINVKKGDQYNCSLFVKRNIGRGNLLIKLVGNNNVVLSEAVVNASTSSWKKISVVLTSSAEAKDAYIALQPLSAGSLSLDMISLFPKNTFKARPNGLRVDLAQTIADIHPRFVRFPGGCVAHGDGLGNIYRWKNTIGPLESRKPQRNLWGYHQSAGLGYFEYFRFCEDIGAEPVPVLAAGVPCQNSAVGGGGQQGGIPMNEMDEYVQDILDLVEYANGDVTTTWGKQRAAAGHPKPFNLKYIGIGNEDLITDIFEERYTMILHAMKQQHPEITVIGTVGPNAEGTDYEEGWKLADKLAIAAVDEHYYQSPGWFINNQSFYDKYDRSKSKVYLGEYAAHLPGRPSNIETALAEALYLTALERNGDVVTMSSYAPLLAKEGHTQWKPDLIYFDNTEVKTTTDYEVQKLFGQNSGNEYLPAEVIISSSQDAVKKRIATSIVRDTKTGDVIVKMINLLPVATTVTIDFKGINIANTSAIKTVLAGKPADTNSRRVVSSINIGQTFTASLADYSFTVVRIKTRE
ncbi:MAG: alpha-L-arabinofuranosidase [Ferruginibacter sp.]|uniref:alpha-L-arabinofuranosidase C-terminal domain-containing protein n=1 Tax=Ferruginibacter sp. TaxID=1940288 RepID=UPI0026591E05|nr:alpha-L-arabinofuranosidase C-terminal domain-containing protein [Ferruginibacter sp.]MDB5280254.1 alpha-L-arabinofuranosidase [Ferruginibacter sp.]